MPESREGQVRAGHQRPALRELCAQPDAGRARPIPFRTPRRASWMRSSRVMAERPPSVATGPGRDHAACRASHSIMKVSGRPSPAMKARQETLVVSRRPSGPTRARSCKRPQPIVDSHARAAGSGSSAQRRSRSGSASKKAATVAPIAMAPVPTQTPVETSGCRTRRTGCRSAFRWVTRSTARILASVTCPEAPAQRADRPRVSQPSVRLS